MWLWPWLSAVGLVQGWMNAAGGPVRRDPVDELLRSHSPAPEGFNIPVLHHQGGGRSRDDSVNGTGMLRGSKAGVSAALKTRFPYVYSAGFLAAGNDIGSVEVESYEDALALCTAAITCKGITYNGQANFTGNKTKVYLKRSCGHRGG